MITRRGRIVVLASGGGTNCQALIDASSEGALDADIVAVVTNNAEAGVIARAEAAGIPVRVIEHRGSDPAVRRDADRRLIDIVAAFEPDVVVLAGWMRILGAEVGAAFDIINLHPAKPGEFPGTRAIERAHEAWTRGEISESGVMVHWVPDAGVDVGPVIATRAVPFEPGDTVDTFAERMHAVEHQLIVAATATALVERASESA
jgi:formyltetrahydrofolate-dependent phosphoribosylglycinamide formyltransferase